MRNLIMMKKAYRIACIVIGKRRLHKIFWLLFITTLVLYIYNGYDLAATATCIKDMVDSLR